MCKLYHRSWNSCRVLFIEYLIFCSSSDASVSKGWGWSFVVRVVSDSFTHSSYGPLYYRLKPWRRWWVCCLQSELLIRVGHRCLKSICFQESLFGFAHIEYEFGVLGSKNLVLLWRSSFSQAEQVGVRFSGVPFNLFYFYVSSTFVKWGFAGSVSTLPVC